MLPSREIRIFLSAVLLTSTAGTIAVGANLVRVGRGMAPRVDGLVEEGEWQGARVLPLAGGGTVQILHDGEDVYFGLSGLPGKGYGFGCLFLAFPDRVLVLHASAQLGSAVYEQGRDGNRSWNPRSSTYTWQRAKTIFPAEGWMADVSLRDGSRGREFRVSRGLLGRVAVPAKVALGYVVQTQAGESASVITSWPPGLSDAVVNRALLEGRNPDGLSFRPESWAQLELK